MCFNGTGIWGGEHLPKNTIAKKYCVRCLFSLIVT